VRRYRVHRCCPVDPAVQGRTRKTGLSREGLYKVLSPGIDQPKVSELMRGRLTRFSTERLMAFLVRLGRDVEIVVREPRSDRATLRGRIHVRAMRPRRIAKTLAGAPAHT
jgi:hypothetical protein